MNQSKTVALYGVWAAVIFVTLLLETYVFSAILPVAPPAIFSLAATFSFCVFRDWKTGLAGGAVFGACSTVVALMIGNPYFMLPWISVLPRVAAGGIAWATSAGVSRLTKNAQKTLWREDLPAAVGGLFGVLSNTLLVLTMLSLTTDAYSGSFVLAMKAILVTNTIFELAAGLFLVPVVVRTIKKAYFRRNGR